MELLSETRNPQQALNYAVNRESGLANQQEILRSNNTNWNTVSYVRTNRQRKHNQNTQQKQNPCWKCGGTFSLAHLQKCPAKSTTCKICKKPGHYTSLCTAKMPERRPQNTPQSSSAQNYKQPQTRRIRNINQEETESEQLEESVDAEAALYIKELHVDWQNINIIRPTQFSPQKNNFINKESNGEFWVETTTQSHKLQWLADTGSPRSFINQEFAQKLRKEIQNIRIEKFTENTIYKCFNNNNIEIEGVLIIDIQSGSWTAKSCKVLIVKNKTINIMGRDLLSKLGITLNASKNTGKPINFISNLQTEKNIIKWVFQKYPHLCTRLGRSKNHIAKSIFKSTYTPSQHKGRRVPLHLLEKVENELKKLIDDKQIIKLEKCSDELFISPVVITVKKDKSVKIALDSKKLNDAIHKNKYQMQSIDHLMDSVAVYISERKNKQGKYFFSKIDLKYAYSQIPLDDNIKKHCNFNILGGKATGTYRFINGFYGLTDMPATFQKTIDKTLHDLNSKFAYLDDILIITKGTLAEHEKEFDKILYRLNEENLAIKLQKCEFAKEQIIWLGFTITPNGVTPTKHKCDAITNLDNPKTLKQLRSFMGCIHHLIKFIPKLAEISEPLRPLVSKAKTKAQNKLDWKEHHTKAFNQIKDKIKQITENRHFDTTKQTRVRCDASKKGLGACLEQKYGSTWETIAFASRFLNNLESRYSTNELELLAVVWSMEHFKYYLYGSEFILQTDHQALLTALKENRGNKTYQSRLTRWVDRLLPFHFSVGHIPGKNMGFADYLSRNPSGDPIPPSEEDKNFVINVIDELNFTLIRNTLTPNGAIKATNQNADIKQVNNDVISSKQNNNTAPNAFRLNSIENKLHSHPTYLNSLHPNKTTSTDYSILVAITTRQKPLHDTFQVPIHKRYRAPNKQNPQTEIPPQMENPDTSKTFKSSSTQTEYTTNKGKGLDPIDPTKHSELFTAFNDLPTPLYRLNLTKVFNEELLSEASQKELKIIMDYVKTENWEDLKKVNPLYYRIRRDLSVTPTNCLLYDNRLVIPSRLKQLVLDTIHHNHPGQAGMLALAKLIWWPHIHS